MTAREAMNSSPAVDAAIDPAQSAGSHNLQIVVKRAQDQLRQLTLQRQEIAQRIAILKRTINGLAHLYGVDLQRSPADGATPARKRGITNACRVVLTRTDTALSAHEIYGILQEEFPDLFRQPGNHYASLVTILSRLVRYGEADTLLRNGSRCWQRHQSGVQQSVGSSGTRIAVIGDEQPGKGGNIGQNLVTKGAPCS